MIKVSIIYVTDVNVEKVVWRGSKMTFKMSHGYFFTFLLCSITNFFYFFLLFGFLVGV